MSLQSMRELEVTCKKLQELEQLFALTLTDSSQTAYGRDLTLRFLRRSVNQLKEEIARFEARLNSMSTKK